MIQIDHKFSKALALKSWPDVTKYFKIIFIFQQLILTI